jgi:hypothetical protein
MKVAKKHNVFCYFLNNVGFLIEGKLKVNPFCDATLTNPPLCSSTILSSRINCRLCLYVCLKRSGRTNRVSLVDLEFVIKYSQTVWLGL